MTPAGNSFFHRMTAANQTFTRLSLQKRQTPTPPAPPSPSVNFIAALNQLTNTQRLAAFQELEAQFCLACGEKTPAGLCHCQSDE